MSNEPLQPQPQYGEYAPPPQPFAAAQPVLRAPEGTGPYTVWIWLLLFVPMLGLAALIPFFGVDWTAIMRAAADAAAAPTADAALASQASATGQVLGALGPAYALSALGGLVLDAALIVFAWLDWRELGRRGAPQPFHWTWIFTMFAGAGTIVYVIGRIVVVRRRTGGGLGVLWGFIATMVVSLAAAIALLVVIGGAVLQVVLEQVTLGA